MSKPEPLLSREAFREAVFARDRQRCVICQQPAIDAHHILERRLFDNGGYYLSNGASLCATHHLAAEMTTLSVEDIRHACGITRPVIPLHLYDDQPYDKWGNAVLANGQRLKGELFDDESVQKILRQGGVLDRYTDRVKYPRTYHLPWSEGLHDDDRMMPDTRAFEGRRVIVSTKLDGENTSMYTDHFHARSLDSRGGAERDWAKGFWAQRRADIPSGWRVCVENLFARHSIAYDDLPSYVMGFSVWNAQNVCLGWDDTLEWFDLLDIRPVPVLYDGIFDRAAIQALWNPRDWARCEGYVVRLAETFPFRAFRHAVGKFVRANHVQTVPHGWRRQLVRNGLAT